MSDQPEQQSLKVAEAAHLLRMEGYTIITQAEKAHRDRWQQEAWDREAQLQDEKQQLIWAYMWLLDRATEAVAPTRPRWLRHARSWWHNHRYTEPIVVKGVR